jgi:hypothetical protein
MGDILCQKIIPQNSNIVKEQIKRRNTNIDKNKNI